MTSYVRYGTAPSLFDAGAHLSFALNLLYHTGTEFGIRNPDGSYTYFYGAGLVWDDALGRFTAGTITAIKHYSGGAFNDKLEGLNLSVIDVQNAFESNSTADALRAYFLSGNDILDARYRLDGAVVPAKLIGFGGDDLIYGGQGDDLLGGGDGIDTIYGGGGNDKIYGGIGDDKMYGGDGIDRFLGDAGADTMEGGVGDDLLHGAAGNDVYFGGSGIDTAIYTRSLYDLIITKTATVFKIIEPHGDDALYDIERLATDEGIFVWNAATSSWQQIAITPGELLLHPGQDRQGTAAGEVIDLAGTGKNIVLAFDGNDTVYGTVNYDLLLGGGGNDLLIGERNGQPGNTDRLYGQDGNDVLHGRAGDDMLYGGAGKDRIFGGNGYDTMTGGAGADVFMFAWDKSASSPESWGGDVITDFAIGSDHLGLIFRNLPPGTGTAPVLTDTPVGALISLSGAGSILLRGVSAAGHTLDDFLL
jgi:Ca2+-binding RTX toxin-like protein